MRAKSTNNKIHYNVRLDADLKAQDELTDKQRESECISNDYGHMGRAGVFSGVLVLNTEAAI
jgi:hypothetical protein